MRNKTIESYELKSKNTDRTLKTYTTAIEQDLKGKDLLTRTEALSLARKALGTDCAYIATTGKTGRELFEIEDSANQFYMVGSMGCALPIGLGVTLGEYQGKVCVFDGDGALLMRLGNMALAGQMNTQNLCHLLLDNGVHDSTGGQKTDSEKIDFSQIAKACGYARIVETDQAEKYQTALTEFKAKPQLTFIRLLIKAGSPKNLGRPTVTPAQVALRLKQTLQS
jgi:phosphonopyruvate decarboxylase